MDDFMLFDYTSHTNYNIIYIHNYFMGVFLWQYTNSVALVYFMLICCYRQKAICENIHLKTE